LYASLPLLVHLDHQLHFKNLNTILFRLEDYRKLCGKFPDLGKGLNVLNTVGSCSNYDAKNYNTLTLYNGYGFEYEYFLGDGNYFIVSKSYIHNLKIDGKDYKIK